MKASLKGKLILSFLAVALITILVVSTVLRLSSGQSLMNMVVDQETATLTEAVEEYYATAGSLEGVYEYYLQNNPYQFGGPPSGGGKGGGEGRGLRGLGGLVDTDYRTIFPTFGVSPGNILPDTAALALTPIKVDGKVIAYIVRDEKYQFNLSAEEELFLKRTNLAIGLAAAAGVLIAVAMGFLLAGGLLKPIRRLTRASKSLATGALGEQVPVTSKDELGELTRTFNQMSADLFKADEQRKRLTADITHDLGTPLQVISGYVEMFEEKGVEVTPERLEIIKTEVGHLRRMVSDLSVLSQAEAGGLDIQCFPIETHEIVESVYQSFQPIAARQGVELVMTTTTDRPMINVDKGRMIQVLMNLVENALRYTPEGGRITLGVILGENVSITVTDTGSGIEPEDLPYVFDRFYRADKARSGNSGKMGLGLAICKALVVAQGGDINVASKGKGQGTIFTISFEQAN